MKTVLVVDDSRVMRTIVKSYFSDLKIPCNYIEAVDGSEALEQLHKNEVDLVFLDWNMPKISGIDFLKHVRSMKKFKDLPIIMVTSEAARYNVIEALKTGANDYIIKPINGKMFNEKMAKILAGRGF